jgi:hypothetical protein
LFCLNDHERRGGVRASSWTSRAGCGSLGLEQYEAAFRANEIDETVLPNLTAEDLKELGVGAVGHRRKLLDAITALRVEGNKASPPEAYVTIDKPAREIAAAAAPRAVSISVEGAGERRHGGLDQYFRKDRR